MSNQEVVSFHEAIDIIESLPEYQQENLIDIVRHRLIERSRQLLIKNVKEARKEYTRGEIKKGTVDDLMKELAEWENLFGVKPLLEPINGL